MDGANQAYGVDVNFSFFQNVTANGYYARSESVNRSGDEDSFQGRFDYAGDRYGVRVDYLDVGANYYPEIGFVQRRGFGRAFASARFSPRMRTSKVVRRYLVELAPEYVINRNDAVESSRTTARFLTEFQSSDQITVDLMANYELLERPFLVSPGVSIQPGEYPFNNATVSYAFGQQRRMSGTVALQAGQFYDGTLTSLTSQRRARRHPQAVLRFDYAFTRLRFFSALLQYNSADRTVSSNFRLRWEYQPCSEFFVVYRLFRF